MKQKTNSPASAQAFVSGRLTTAFVLLMVSLVTLHSCRKDRVPAGPVEKKLNIGFTQNTIALADVDSALVVLNKEGSNQPILRKLDKGPVNLNMLLDNSPAGNWTADVYIYTKKSGNINTSRMFTRSVSFQLPLNADINVEAPTGAVGGAWKPHNVQATPNNEVVLIVAADNAEPYFEVRVKDSKWDYFYIERYAYNKAGGMTEQVAAGAWECFTSCYTNDRAILNATAFQPFADQVKTKTWNLGEVFAIVADSETGEEKTFFFIYDKS